MLNADKYQKLAARTLLAEPENMPSGSAYMVVWAALGLGGEAGEVQDLVKKGICHEHGLDSSALIKELGDVLWYVAAICTQLGVKMSDVMDYNIAKLKVRYPEGYSSSASVSRIDTEIGRWA